VGFDVFVSYAKADRERVLGLCEALTAHGVAIWPSDAESQTRASIQDALAGCKALVAFYSHAYATRRACQWELTAALLAAQAEGDALRGVLVVNPEQGAEHIQPPQLRDVLLAAADDDDDAPAQHIAAHVRRLDGALGGLQLSPRPSWLGRGSAPAPRFVGRARELWAVHGALSAAEVALITGTRDDRAADGGGIGGVGKSLLVREYALRFAAAYPGGVFWLRGHGRDEGGAGAIDAARDARRDTQLLGFAKQLAIEVAQLVAHQVPGALARTLDERGQAFLWIVDDLPGGLSLPELDDWLAPGRRGRTLLTTRSRDYDAIAARIDVGALSSREGVELLTDGRAPHGREEEHAARRLVDDLGGHALALDVAGTALHAGQGVRSYVAYRDALARPAEDEPRLAAGLAGRVPGGHEASIAGVLARSIGRLDDAAVDLLRLASRLAVDTIAADLVAAAFASDHGFHEDAARMRAIVAMRAAASWSLAEMSDDAEACEVHPLIARATGLLDRAPARADALDDAATAALTLWLHADAASGSVFAERPATLAHARRLAVARDDERHATLLFAIGAHDLRRGDLRSAQAVHEHALDVYRRVLGDEHPRTLTALDDTAVMLRTQGALAGARALYEVALATRRRLLGEQHPDTLATLNDLIETLRALGDLGGVRALQEQALANWRRRLGDEHPDTLVAMNDLAVTLRAQGELVAARALHEQVLATRRRLLGDEHPDTPVAMSNLAQTLGAQGDLAGTRAQHEQALAVSRRVLGDHHPDTLTSLSSLAETLSQQGDLGRARTLFEHVLTARRMVLGAEHPDVLASMHDLASLLLAQDELAAARALHQQALATRWELLGDEHPDTLESMNDLAVTLLEQGELTHGHTLLTKTLYTLGSMEDRARALCRHADLAGARALREQVLTARRRLHGDEHPDTLTAEHDLADTLRAQGALTRARALQEQVLDGRRRVLGDEHPQTEASRRALAATLRELGESGSGDGSSGVQLFRRWLGRFG
jgi:tetratricopeptide (TPR) repeat protein